MTPENNSEIAYQANKPEDHLFLALCCGHKKLAAKPHETHGHDLSLDWSGNQVTGAAAICLFLEASIPEPSLFPNGNIGMPVALLHWRQSMKKIPAENHAALIANGQLISRQMNDGRPFLQGPAPSLADICAASWCIPHRNLFLNDKTLISWADRMQAIATNEPKHTVNSIASLEGVRGNIQYKGLLEFNVVDGITIITSPLDGVLGSNAASSSQ